MNQPTQNNVTPITQIGELPEPGYPMLTHVVTNALFPDVQSTGCAHCGSSISVPADKSAWIVDQPHPLAPEMTVVRMFLEEDGVEIYSVPNRDKKACSRSFIPTNWIRFSEEVMPLNIFVEELARTVKPGVPTIGRMVSSSFFDKPWKTNCPSCKAITTIQAPSDKTMGEPIVWIVGQAHPHTLSGTEMKILRIAIEDNVVWIYSISGDGQNGMRHSFSVEWLRFAEEGMAPDVFLQELEKAENGGEEEEELEDPDAEPEDEPTGEGDVEPEPPSTPVTSATSVATATSATPTAPASQPS